MGIVLIIGRVIEPESLTYPILKNSFITPKSFKKLIKKLENKFVKLSQFDPKSENVSLVYEGGTYDQFFSYLNLPNGIREKVALAPTTAFIGTKNYPLVDKFLIALSSFAKLGLKLPPFSFLDQKFVEEISLVAPNGEITARSSSIFVQALLRANIKDRVVALHYFGEVLKDSLDIPEDRLFMTQDELRSFSGELILASYSGASIFEIGNEAGIKDLEISESILELKSKIYLPVHYSVPVEFLPLLKNLGINKIILSSETDLSSFNITALPGLRVHEENYNLNF